MIGFIRHPKFWLVLLLLTGIELAFRAGIWEPMVRPDSYAGTSVKMKWAIDRFGPRRIGTVTLGDSRAVYGFDHRRLLERTLGTTDPVHASLALPGTHLATLEAESRWIGEHLPGVERVVIGVAVSSMDRIGNGYYEIGLVSPFQGVVDYAGLRRHFPPASGEPRSLGSLSAFMAYREDVFQAMRQPVKRWHQVERSRLRSPAAAIGFRNNRENDLCELDLRSIESCRAEFERFRSQGRGRDPLAVSMNRHCRARPERPEAVEAAAIDAWSAWFEAAASDHRLTVVRMPEHSLFADRAEPGSEVLDRLSRAGVIDLLDLSGAFKDAPEPECAYYSDLVHANVAGMNRLTDRLIDHLQRATQP